MTRKEVKMSGKIRIGGLVFAAALIVLGAWFAFGQANQDPCGGHYAGEGLKALFWPSYGLATCNSSGNCNVLNDIEGQYYRYMVPGGDCIYLYRDGHVFVGIGNSGRDVVINIDQFSGGSCPFPYPNGTYHTTEFSLRTGNGFTPSIGFKGDEANPTPDPNALVLTDTNAKFNFKALKTGETYYCQTSIKFKLGSSILYEHHFQAKVCYGVLQETGALGWRVTPIDEYYYVYDVVKVGKKLIPVEPATKHDSSVYGTIISANCPDNKNHGTYCLPFKLILERLP